MSYRAVTGESPGRKNHGTVVPDAFLDSRGRVWYAQSVDQLPTEPQKYEKVPEEFWHPDSRRHMDAERRRTAEAQHDEQRMQQRATQLSVMQ